MHFDIVKYEWYVGNQTRVIKVDVLDRSYLKTEILRPLLALEGDYLYSSLPHSEEECPFKDSDCIPIIGD